MVATQIETICDAWVNDLTSNVAGLQSAITHSVVPWDPEELSASVGERHLGIWPAAEAVETMAPLTTDGHELTGLYDVLVWEEATAQSERLQADELADRAFLRVYEDTRNRLYVVGNQTLAGTQKTWFARSTFPRVLGTTRYFLIEFTAIIYKAFSASGAT